MTSCTPPAQATRDAVLSQAQIAAAALIGTQQVEAVMPQLIAIENNIAGATGSWMFLNDVGKIAIFVTNAGKTSTGAPFYFIGTVDVAGGKLIDTARILREYGIDFSRIKTLEDFETVLRARGFTQLVPAALPTLYATLKMALSFVKSIGGSAIDLLVVPAGLISPAQAQPWCMDGSVDCVGIKT